jgi:hypothetical protein
MIFPEYQDAEIKVYRLTPTTGWSDSAWVLIATISGRIEPVAADENLRNQQIFQNVTEVCFSPVSAASVVLPGDGFIDSYGIKRKVIGSPEIWRNINPYAMFMLERAQWDIG